MRRLVVLIAAVCVASALPAAAMTRKAADEVTISLSKPIVVYGGAVTLSGTVSNHKAGEKVALLAEPYGEPTFTGLAVENTSANGEWSHVDSPDIQTTYRAQWNTTASRAVTVKVRPKVTLRRVARTLRFGVFRTTVTGNRSFAGKFVAVQRLGFARTITLKRVKLNADSSATFKLRLPLRTWRLRVVISTAQAAPGYIAGFSPTIRAHR